MSTGLTRLAGIWSRDPKFIEWVSDLASQRVTPDDAAELIRLACKIKSRRELDTDVAAAALFNYSIRRPFLEWRQQQQNRRAA